MGTDELNRRVREWLEHEGYPLEFRVADLFQRSGFSVRQGHYVSDPESGALREIDVLASIDGQLDDRLLRIHQVIECKWSKDKPWVVFTRRQNMAASACIAQTIGSQFGSAILWKEAGLPSLHKLRLFSSPDRAGFSGRQALSKDGSDRFYQALTGVIGLTKRLADQYDLPKRKPRQLPDAVVVAFPVVVVDGPLFEAFLLPGASDVSLEPATHIRCHWRGSRDWPLHATVDIVTFEHLDTFVSARAADVKTLCRIMRTSAEEIEAWATGTSSDALRAKKAPRGVVGGHRLLSEFVRRGKRVEVR